jgi:hypothetical protein
MVDILNGRHTAEPPEGTVTLIIGTRINAIWKVHCWLPFFTGMVRMLKELLTDKERHGFLGYHVWFGRTTLMIQYWRSMDDLLAYSRAQPMEHVPTWRLFNRTNKGELGVFHEAYTVTRRGHHVIYRDMPASFGLGGATSMVPARSHPGTSPTEWNDKDRADAERWGEVRTPAS